MERPSYLGGVDVARQDRRLMLIGRFAALVLLFLLALPGFAAHVPIRDGQGVKLQLLNVLTTDNVRKDDKIEFTVMEDVLVNGHVVIAKGATARGKIVDVKGAFKPRAKDAEVVFQFSTVTAVDKQELPLRVQPEKPRKGGEKVEEIHEKSPIPGQISRVVGADKGREYEAYVAGQFTVSTSDVIVSAPTTSPTAPAEVQPGAPVIGHAVSATSPPPATDEAGTTSGVEFDSTPDGAEIVVDGNHVGNTHSTLYLTTGHHDIEIRMAGYRTWSRRMVVDPGSHQSVRATLIPQ